MVLWKLQRPASIAILSVWKRWKVFQDPLKLAFSRAWPNGKEEYPLPYITQRSCAAQKGARLTYCNLLTFLLLLLLNLVENPVLFKGHTTMRLC